MNKLVLVVLLMLIITGNECARILGIVPTPSYSHQTTFQPLFRELSLRGHQVTTLTTEPINDPELVNLTEIDLHFSYDVWKAILSEAIGDNIVKSMVVILEAMQKISRVQLEHPPVQDLLRNQTATFDLVILEYTIPAMMPFAQRFNCPFIGVVPMDSSSPLLKLFGHPTHKVLYPDSMLSFTDHQTFFELIQSVIFTSIIELYYHYHFYPNQQKLVNSHFGANYSPLDELAANVSLLFINSYTVFHKVKPLLPNVIPVGGIHLRPSKPLPKELQEVLDSASEGAVYFSLGTNVNSTDLPGNVQKAILEMFAELPYVVLWKFESENIPDKPRNVITARWFPHQDVLNHPNMKLFITHGGLQSVHEAIQERIPMVAIPFLADQFANAKIIVDKGIGLSLDCTELDKGEFKDSIVEVIENPKYKNRIEELSELVADHPETGLERAVWWTEYVIRHRGAKHFRSPFLNIPFYQYYLLDVIGTLSLIFVLFLFAIYFLTKVTLLLVSRTCSKLKQKRH